jgi:hypothetical protein
MQGELGANSLPPLQHTVGIAVSVCIKKQPSVSSLSYHFQTPFIALDKPACSCLKVQYARLVFGTTEVQVVQPSRLCRLWLPVPIS